ncbi:hypothetical protein [Paenibacillus xylanilyticus]|uniref:Uncharacterized protein n=1 Tax=Paenibacillus xylanilyticus TaxID=248903 RepID=A0A7Y6BS33_9BACL|nr:hypothetical protein [Paenibacillus xylanilyticus]NUU73935.1 hypothetical protein [Paenibacillus xylanilyticus]
MVNVKSKIIGLIGLLLTVTIVFVCSYQIYLNVGHVHNYFSPKLTSVIAAEDASDGWKPIIFDGKDSIEYDSIFWHKAITNGANSDRNVLLRVKDAKGDIVIEEFQVSPGTSKHLDHLNNDTKYFFEIKAEEGQFILNAT